MLVVAMSAPLHRRPGPSSDRPVAVQDKTAMPHAPQAGRRREPTAPMAFTALIGRSFHDLETVDLLLAGAR